MATGPDKATLNVVQQVLKGLMTSLAAANRTDLTALGNLLETYAQLPGLDPVAREMLNDLSEWPKASGLGRRN